MGATVKRECKAEVAQFHGEITYDLDETENAGPWFEPMERGIVALSLRSDRRSRPSQHPNECCTSVYLRQKEGIYAEL